MFSLKRLTASCPFSTCSTTAPWAVKSSVAISAFSRLSSASRMRMPSKRYSSFGASKTGAGAVLSSQSFISNSNENSAPVPRALFKWMVSPICSMILLLIGSPNPVPWLLEDDVPSCSNAWKIRSCASGAMPMPLSFTMKRKRAELPLLEISCTISSIRPPSGVNLTAFPPRFTRTCFKRIESAIRLSWHTCLSRIQVIFFMSACARIIL